VNCQSVTSHKADFQRWNVDPVRVTMKDRYEPVAEPFDGIATYTTSYVRHNQPVRPSMKPDESAAMSDAPLQVSRLLWLYSLKCAVLSGFVYYCKIQCVQLECRSRVNRSMIFSSKSSYVRSAEGKESRFYSSKNSFKCPVCQHPPLWWRLKSNIGLH